LKVRKAVLDTGLFRAHLAAGRDEQTSLRAALRTWFCYTTVFNAMELFAGAGSPRQRRAVEDVLSAVKILGMNGRNAGRFAKIAPVGRGGIPLSALIAGICIEARLPLVTDRIEAFERYRKLRAVKAPRTANKR
jgi:predicted nucleic acid-binding protein